MPFINPPHAVLPFAATSSGASVLPPFGTLGVGHPVTLSYDNGQGLVFSRTIAVDDHYLFTIKDDVANKGGSAVTLFPYALISRHGTPKCRAITFCTRD